MNFNYMRVLIVGDNGFILNSVSDIIHKKQLNKTIEFDFAYTTSYLDEFDSICNINKMNLKTDKDYILNKYDLIISAHCKQIFPSEIVKNIKCINLHPGFNPYNRGWFPHIFSIINGLPAGATIHQMDEEIDNGDIITQKEVKVHSSDTSESLYKKILKTEIELFSNIIEDILKNNYTTFKPKCKGNINYKKDFDRLRELNLNQRMTVKELIDILRAVSYKDYKNAYFIDENGHKVYVRLFLEKE